MLYAAGRHDFMKTVKTCGPKGSPHAQWYASDVLLISCEEQHAPEDNLQSWICLLLFLPTVTNFADSKTFTPVLCNTFHLAVLVSQTCEFMGRHPSGTFFPIYPDFIFTLLIMCERRETNLVPVKKVCLPYRMMEGNLKFEALSHQQLIK